MKCPSWYKLYMLSESESEDDLLAQAYDYKVNGKYAEGCKLNKKRSIRRKADKIVLQNAEVCYAPSHSYFDKPKYADAGFIVLITNVSTFAPHPLYIYILLYCAY